MEPALASLAVSPSVVFPPNPEDWTLEDWNLEDRNLEDWTLESWTLEDWNPEDRSFLFSETQSRAVQAPAAQSPANQPLNPLFAANPSLNSRTPSPTILGARLGAAPLPDSGLLPLGSKAFARLQPPLSGALSDSLGEAQLQPAAVFLAQGFVETRGVSDRFQFSLGESGVFTANLSALTADADVQLIQDKNRNSTVDPGEILAWQWERGTKAESVRRFLGAGEYVLQVVSRDLAQTAYQVQTTFTPAPVDPLKFSLALSKRTGLEPLTAESLAAVERAAKFWEGVITHSSFVGAQTLSVGLYGTQNPSDTFLAYAGPQNYRKTASDRLLPASGVAVINMAYATQYNANPAYLELVMRHEFAHVLGFGVTWERNGNTLVSKDRKTYRADTYAGQAYGALVNELQGLAIPLDDERVHWQEAALDAELMTPRAETLGTATPLSQVSIASLRDLGWNVNYGAAEAFTLQPTLAATVPGTASQALVIV